MCFFFFKQKTAYDLRISDWSSDVSSSDLLGASDVVLMPSPVTHITGYLYALEMGFVTGCAAVLMERLDASEAVELIKRHGVTMSVGATPFLRELTDTVVSAGALLPTMRLIICGGAPVARIGRASCRERGG